MRKECIAEFYAHPALFFPKILAELIQKVCLFVWVSQMFFLVDGHKRFLGDLNDSYKKEVIVSKYSRT